MTPADDIDAILTAAGVPAGGCVWLTYDPDDGWEQYDTEREARDALDCIVDHLRDDSSEGWHEEAERAALYRCERAASLVLTTTATRDDDTEDGRRCRSEGWDFFARGDIVEHETAVARLVAEAQRPTTAVDLDAVATARRVLLLLSDHADTMPTGDRDGFGLVIYNGLHLRDADWPDIATTLRALAARLGGAS